MKYNSKATFVVVACMSLTACEARTSLQSGGSVELRVAALTLPAVANVCYDIAVSTQANTVWAKGDPLNTRGGRNQRDRAQSGIPDGDSICSDTFGDGTGGDITYIGPCDSSAAADTHAGTPGTQNDVTIRVDGLYDATGVDIGAWRDPCGAAGCTISLTCEENEDALAEFNLTLMREANQGFFDIAIGLEDVFCSAKFDTCYDDDHHIELLHGADDARDWTGVFAFACSAGAGASATNLLYGLVTVDCGDAGVFVLDPTADAGNASVSAGANTLHYGIYRGLEELDCGSGPGSCKKVYWNLALSIDDLVALNSTCTLSFSATVNDDNQGFSAGRPVATGLIYPYVDVRATLTTAGLPPATTGDANCQRHALDASDGVVSTAYKGTVRGVPEPPVMCSQYNGSVSATDATEGCAVDSDTVPRIGTPVALSSVPSASGCGFSSLNHAVFTNTAGTTFIATSEHRPCDTMVDRLVVYTNPTDGEWTSATPFTYDYSATTSTTPGTLGMPDGISVTGDRTGAPHVLSFLRRDENGHGAAGAVYLRQAADSWAVTQDAFTDEAIQQAADNSAGASQSGFGLFSLSVDDADQLHFLATDTAPSATRSNVVYASAPIGSATWNAAEPLYSRLTSVPDHTGVLVPAQDFIDGFGVQVWIDAPTCTLMGRELAVDGWGPTNISVPLGYAACSGDAADGYGIGDPYSAVFLSAAGEPTFFFAAHPSGQAGPLTFIILARSGGSWTNTTSTPPWGAAFALPIRAYHDASDRLRILHADPSRSKLLTYDVVTGVDTILYSTDHEISAIDAESHDPRVIVWTELDGTNTTLQVADLTSCAAGACSRLRDQRSLVTPRSVKETIARELFSKIDLSRPSMADLTQYRLAYTQKQLQDHPTLTPNVWEAALDAWRDITLEKFRARNFGMFTNNTDGYYLTHPGPRRPVQIMAGIFPYDTPPPWLTGPAPLNYVASHPNYSDFRHIRNFLAGGNSIDWYAARPAGKHDEFAWQTSWAGWAGGYWQGHAYPLAIPPRALIEEDVPLSVPANREAYLERYFKLYSEVFYQAPADWWRGYADYANSSGSSWFTSNAVNGMCWNDNLNHLPETAEVVGAMQSIKAFANSLADSDIPTAVLSVLSTYAPSPQLPLPVFLRHPQDARFGDIDSTQLAKIALGMERYATGPLLFFGYYPGAPPNQRLSSLQGLILFAGIFDEFKRVPDLQRKLRQEASSILDAQFLPDGTDLEQAFNYNAVDRTTLREIYDFLEPSQANPAWQSLRAGMLATIERLDGVKDLLLTPLAGLPQVGGNGQIVPPDFWSSLATAVDPSSFGLTHHLGVDMNGAPKPYLSAQLPYAGYFAQRDGWEATSRYLFFYNNRPQITHQMRGTLSVQIVAYGRQLAVPRG